MESRMSKSPPSSPAAAQNAEGYGDERVTSRLYLYRPGPGAGPLDKDAVLRRIRHRRRASRLQDTLRSLLFQQQHAAPEPDGDSERPAWPEDAFSSP
ncbi:unnamed protein product [Alopecurus aequalis]